MPLYAYFRRYVSTPPPRFRLRRFHARLRFHSAPAYTLRVLLILYKGEQMSQRHNGAVIDYTPPCRVISLLLFAAAATPHDYLRRY